MKTKNGFIATKKLLGRKKMFANGLQIVLNEKGFHF
jgi:hypothetical protein